MKTSWVFALKRPASTPSPIGTVVTTLPLWESTTTITLLPHPENKAMVRLVKSQRTGILAWDHWPRVQHCEFGGVDLGDLTLVFDVDEDFSLFVGGGKLRFPTQRDRTHHFAGGCIHDRRIFAPRVESEHVLGEELVHDGVGPLADFDVVQFLERLQIEDGDAVVAAIADEAAVQLRCEGDPVDAGEVRDVTGDFEGGCVHHHHMRAAGDEQSVAVFVVVKVIQPPSPPSLTRLTTLYCFCANAGTAVRTAAAMSNARTRFISISSLFCFCVIGNVTQVKVNGWSDDQRQHHRNGNPSDYRDGERLQHLRTGAQGQCQRQHPGDGGHGRHYNRSQTASSGLNHRILGRMSGSAEALVSVEQQDAVLGYDANDHN